MKYFIELYFIIYVNYEGIINANCHRCFCSINTMKKEYIYKYIYIYIYIYIYSMTNNH